MAPRRPALPSYRDERHRVGARLRTDAAMARAATAATRNRLLSEHFSTSDNVAAMFACFLAP